MPDPGHWASRDTGEKLALLRMGDLGNGVVVAADLVKNIQAQNKLVRMTN